MFEFFFEALRPANLLFTAMLGLITLYWLLVAFGAPEVSIWAWPKRSVTSEVVIVQVRPTTGLCCSYSRLSELKSFFSGAVSTLVMIAVRSRFGTSSTSDRRIEKPSLK